MNKTGGNSPYLNTYKHMLNVKVDLNNSYSNMDNIYLTWTLKCKLHNLKSCVQTRIFD